MTELGQAISDARSVNAQLLAFYLSRWSQLCEVAAGISGASNPLLVGIWPDYCLAKTKILVVGQETCGWHGNFTPNPPAEIVSWLQDGYKSFALGECYRSTPFWRFAHLLNNRINTERNHRALAWSNLNPIDIDRGRPHGIEHLLADVSLLSGEVELLKPDAVVFLSGPKYDWLIERQFIGVELQQVGELPDRTMARVVHEALPTKSFRTYHPAYLQRSGQFQSMLDLLGKLISG